MGGVRPALQDAFALNAIYGVVRNATESLTRPRAEIVEGPSYPTLFSTDENNVVRLPHWDQPLTQLPDIGVLNGWLSVTPGTIDRNAWPLLVSDFAPEPPLVHRLLGIPDRVAFTFPYTLKGVSGALIYDENPTPLPTYRIYEHVRWWWRPNMKFGEMLLLNPKISLHFGRAPEAGMSRPRHTIRIDTYYANPSDGEEMSQSGQGRLGAEL